MDCADRYPHSGGQDGPYVHTIENGRRLSQDRNDCVLLVGTAMNVLNLFRNAADCISVEAGQAVFQEGDTGDTMYVVVEGEVAITSKGHEVVNVGPGGIFGEMALIDDAPRSANAVAKTACKLAPVNQKRFHFLVSQTPFFALNVMRIMSERLRKQLPKD
jgi:CRP/FNR family cyclic AMP-dependent transcriptional regulator